MMSEIKFKRDTAFRKTFFVPDSFAHPAKMDAQLLIWIVENYTKAGETILDPMAGSGTTMLACTLGRDVVMVELEEKFCKMCADNWNEVRMRPQLGSSMGNCQVIQGDARQLEGLVDKIVTSPPYAEAKGGDHTRNEDYTGQYWEQIGGIRHRADGTKGSPDNISNLPYGQIDKIVTSPPYASGGHHADQTGAWGGQAQANTKEQANYGQSQGQIGQLNYGNIDSIITSPPYEEGLSRRHKSSGIKDDNRLAQTGSYKTVDKIISSPPYSEGGQGVGKEYHPERMVGNTTGLGRGYSEDGDNIGNLKSDSYLEAMFQVYQQCYKVLRPQGLLILVTKNFIRNKQVIRLDTDTIKLCEQAGFSFLERHYRKLPSQSFWRVIYHQKHPEVEQILNEDVIVFKRLDL